MSSDKHDASPTDPSARPEALGLSAKPSKAADAARLRDVSPHPPGDQVDRSVVVAEMVRDVSMWALRLFIIGAFIYAAARMLGNFWQGVLPVLLALIICTVLAPLSGGMRKAGLPSGLAAFASILLFFGIVGGIIAFVAPNFARQSQTLYLQTVEGIQRLQLWVQGPPLELDSDELSRYIDEAATWIQSRAVPSQAASSLASAP